jgi:hypothetical protein
LEAGIRDRIAQIPVVSVVVDEAEEEMEMEAMVSPVVADDYDEAPVGPSEGEEAVLQDEPFKIRSVQPRSEAEESDERVELPALDELVKRIPAATLKAMDELFRAKFVRVKQIPKKHLKKN